MTSSNPFDISGRLALVTGSARGIGFALAAGLVRAGASVILHDVDGERLAAAATELTAIAAEARGSVPHATAPGPIPTAPGPVPTAPGPVPTAQFDVSDAGAVERGIHRLIADHGVPDILVNNAGIQRRGHMTELATADWDAVIATNVSGAFYVSRFVTPHMVRRGSGKVVNIGSVLSERARATTAPYNTSKAAIAMLTRSMAADLSGSNIQVNCLSPGYIATEMTRPLWEDPDFDRWVRESTPAGRWGTLDELVGALLFLVSPAAGYVTGQNLLVDGGMASQL